MLKLIRAEWSRLWHSVIFKVSLLFFLGMPVFIMLMRYLDIQKYPDVYAEYGPEYISPDALMFVGSLYFMIASAAWIGIFLGTEYADGTLRNKIMAGHRRSNIYLSKVIVCFAATALQWCLGEAAGYLSGRLLLGEYISAASVLWGKFLVGLAALAAMSALFVFCSVLIRNIGFGVAVDLIVAFAALMLALTISQRLDAPEYYSELEQDASGNVEWVHEKNEHYLRGEQRKIYEALHRLPTGQMLDVTQKEEVEEIPLLLLCDGVWVVVLSGIGIAAFGKSNLK